MVWDVATAVAWRIDPDRRLASEFVKDMDINTAVERVYVEKAEAIRTPPRLQKNIAELRSLFPGVIAEIMQFVVVEHIYAALNSDISEAVQDPERAPFLIIGESESKESIFVDIDAMLKEYHEAVTHIADWQRQEEDIIKQVIRNSVTPRFDKVEVKLEEISRKLDFSASASDMSDLKDRFSDVNRRFDDVIEEIRKSRPPRP